jgi:glycogen debranching enzyme
MIGKGEIKSVTMDRKVATDFGEAIKREWLETNGIGGWASSTIINAHTRRYHGLLVAATRPPVGRVVLLSNLEETLVRGGTRYGIRFDVVDGDRRDSAIRPNQIFAISLPFALLGRNRARQVLKTVEDHLLTPIGLRSLSPHNQAYSPTYQGNAAQRDAAYHQGMVWAWLLGPCLTALVKVRGKTGRKQVLKLVQAVQNHLSESGVGQVSEIFDGDAPHAPRGCIAQAWSVAEIARAYMEDLLGACPGQDAGVYVGKR